MKRFKLWVLLLTLSVIAGCNPPKPQPAAFKEPYPIGTVFVSRNRDESQNKSPGYENHLALYVGDLKIVESQEGRGVILTSGTEWDARNYIWHPLYFKDAKLGVKAAAKAKTLVGLPYKADSSLFRVDRNPEKGLNCVSVVRISLVEALGRQLPDLHKPDDIANVPELTSTKPAK